MKFTKHIHLLCSAVLVIACATSHAVIHKVTSLNDSGAGTLRTAISAASPKDTVMMDVKGVINLLSPITITKPMRILGATAMHSQINGSSVSGGGEGFIIQNISAGDTLIIDGFRFEAFDGVNGMLSISNSNVIVINSVFKNNNGTANGQIANTSQTRLKFLNCSFFSNTNGGAEGGVLRNSAGDISEIVNCTFFQCNAAQGGAIRNLGTLHVNHCTFLNNLASLGSDISNASTGTVIIANNIFSNSNPAQEFHDQSGTSWTTNGGNVFTSSSALLSAIIPTIGTDVYTGGTQATLNLKATSVIDGYGLEYYPIISNTSVAIDRGVASSSAVTDQRRAPRVLYGSFALESDAGAIEYTPFRVTAPSGASSFENVWNAMNSAGGNGGFEYMEFDLAAPTTFNVSSLLSTLPSGIVRVIDGYTQHGSAVTGPRNPLIAGNFITPAILPVTVANSTNGVLHCQLWLQGSVIAGLKFTNGQNNAILVTNCDMQIFGNVIIPSAGIPSSGITVQGSNSATNTVIGGDRYYHCNVISGYSTNGSAGIFYIGKTKGKITGNLIGTTTDGTGTNANFAGIYLDDCSNVRVGGRLDLPSRNLISANINDQIYDEGGDNIYRGNYIGTDISGELSLGFGPSHGIHFSVGTRGTIGGLGWMQGNVIVNQDIGIVADNNSGNGGVIYQNYIGVTLGMVPIGNVTGINFNGNSTGYFVGDGSFKGRNYICANSGIGVYIDGASQNSLKGNFIGLAKNNTQSGNAGIGLHIVNGASDNTISNNVISSNGTGFSDAGIHLNSAGTDNYISQNFIGTDSSGLLMAPNKTGIVVDNQGQPNTIITTNVISGNSVEGIQINSAFNQIIITDNIIGLNATQTAAMPNTNGIVCYSSNQLGIVSNIIAGNTVRGMWLSGCADFYIFGNFIGTTTALVSGLGNNADGVYLESNSNSGFIGDTSPLNGNTIAYNGGSGVLLTGQAFNVAILGNSIFNNSGLGISLDNANTPLLNDAGDSDISGGGAGNHGNNGQNYPVNLVAGECNGTVTVTGALSTSPGTYHVEFFAIAPSEVDASGHGEGKIFLGAEMVTAPVGNETFTHIYSGVLPAGSFVTATCSRDNSGNFETSEFSDTAKITITLQSNAGPDVSTCPGSPVLLDGSASTGTGLSYTWQELPGLTLVGLTDTVSVSPTATTSYILSVYDGTCSDDDTIVVTVVSPPNATFTFTNPPPFCSNENPSAIIPVTSGGIFSGPGVTASTFAPSVAGVGTHDIIYTVTQAGCTNADTVSVTVNAAPPLPTLVTAPPFEFCVGSSSGIQVTNNGGLTGWYSNAALTNQICICNPLPASSLQSGNYNLYVAELSSAGCLSQPLTVSGVTVWGPTFINSNGPYETCTGVPVPVNVTIPVNATIQWNSNSAISDTTSVNPTITPSDTTSVYPFVVTMGVTVSCQVASSVNITVNTCELDDISNAFSPDGDGVNDKWIIDAAFAYPNNVVFIYNRWGNVLRRIENYNNDDQVWDGTYNGALVPAGTYYYSIELRDINESRSGWMFITY